MSNTDGALSYGRLSRPAWRRLDSSAADEVELLDHDESLKAPKSHPTHVESPPPTFNGLLWAWLPEILASLISLLSLLATVLILWLSRGRRAAHTHLPRGLTLNGLLAIFATINRSCVVVPLCSGIMQEMWLYLADQGQKTNPTSCVGDFETFARASQGVVGSLMFIYQTRGRRVVACFGCLVAILSLFYSTIVQQLVKLESHAFWNETIPGNLIRSESWHGVEGKLNMTNVTNSVTYLPLNLTAAIYDGVMRGGLEPPLAFCPSGNCTWPLTPSLAVCGRCAPSSYKRLRSVDFGLHEYQLASKSVVTIGDADVSKEWDELEDWPVFQVVPSITSSERFADDGVLYIGDFELFGYPYNSQVAPGTALKASRCALWMCIHVYNTSTTLGVQSQNITNSYSMTNLTGKYNDKTGFVNDVFAFAQTHSTTLPNNKSYTVDGASVFTLQTNLAQYLNGSVSMSGQDQRFTNDLVRGAWNGSTDPQAWIANIALSMTGAVRAAHATSREELNGKMYELAVLVQWRWIILPAALVLMSVAFLALVMIRTARSTVLSWKGSPLVLLLMDLDLNAKEEVYPVADKQQDLKLVIGQRTARMVKQDGHFWKIKAD